MNQSFTEPESRDASRLMLNLLTVLRDEGPLSADGVARLSLTPRQVLAVMPEDQRQTHVMRTIDGLIDLLEENGTEATLVVALKNWQRDEAEARQRLNWETLPPAVHKAAIAAARRVADKAERQHWIETLEIDGKTLWRITPLGGGAIDRIRASIEG